MKKHDEGYALAFVLVVMLVLCLVAVTVLSYSLDNLRQQKIAAQRMQDQYIAQGKIEKVVALVEDALVNNNQGGVMDALKDTDEVKALVNDGTIFNTGKLVLTAQSNNVSITCVLILDDIQNTITYESYTISECDPAEPTEPIPTDTTGATDESQEVTPDG